jgi:hypothetical protein
MTRGKVMTRTKATLPYQMSFKVIVDLYYYSGLLPNQVLQIRRYNEKADSHRTNSYCSHD